MKEARRLNIPVFAMVDTNVNPKLVDFPIPANDDATKSIALILGAACDAIKLGLEDRKTNKDANKDEEGKAAKKSKKDAVAPAAADPVVEEAPVAETPAVEESPVVEEVKADAKADG